MKLKEPNENIQVYFYIKSTFSRIQYNFREVYQPLESPNTPDTTIEAPCYLRTNELS